MGSVVEVVLLPLVGGLFWGDVARWAEVGGDACGVGGEDVW